MLIVLTIFLLLIIPLAMLIFHLARPKFGIQGFFVVLAVLAGWVMVLLARSDIPQNVTLLTWQPTSFFPTSPTLLIDDISWYFALAVMSVTMVVIITSTAQLGLSRKSTSKQVKDKIDVDDAKGGSDPIIVSKEPGMEQEAGLTANWQAWAGILIQTSLGLVAVTAGNMLTMLLAWAALDTIELIILLGQVLQSKLRERIVLAFTARMAGIGVILLAGIIPWSQGSSLTYDAITQSTSIYLIIAAGLRLGILPLHLPLLHQLPLRRGLGTVIRLIPAAASYILLVRVADVGVLGPSTPYLLGLTALAGIYAGINWLNSSDEINGRPFWLLGTAALAVSSAILNHQLACIAWSLASLFTGGLIFSMSIHHKNLIPIAVLGLVNFSALPFIPTWLGTSIYQYTTSLPNYTPPMFFYLFSLLFMLTHALLFTGLVRHMLRGIFSPEKDNTQHVERWVWFLYPIGLVFTSVTHFIVGLLFKPTLSEIPLSGWLAGAVTLAISAGILYISNRLSTRFPQSNQSTKISPLNRLLSMDWFYRTLWQIFRLLARFTSLLSTILEGEGGILWALVLFALIFVFLQR